MPVPPADAGKEAVDVRFTYDLNGLLEVEVTVVSTKEKKRTVIEENPGVLTKEEIEKRLKALDKIKLHPRDDLVNKQLITRAERIYEEVLGNARELIGQRLALFISIISKQNPQEIARAREEFNAFLNQLESVR